VIGKKKSNPRKTVASDRCANRPGCEMLAEPHVGIVFLLGESLLIESTPLSQVTAFAGCRDREGAHVEFWDEVRGRRQVEETCEYDQLCAAESCSTPTASASPSP
jgi:hypothetical protein